MLATASPSPKLGTKTASDLQQLQGAWTTVAGPRQALLLIAGNRFAFELLDGDIYMGTFALVDPDSHPRRMDMRIDEGPAAYRGRITPCIYEVASDSLRWCPARPGSEKGLTRFPSVDDTQHLSLVFKHVRPHQKKIVVV